MIYSFLFFIVVFITCFFAKQGTVELRRKELSYNASVLISFIIIFLFIGLRYNVGRDFPSHWLDYKYLDYDDFGYLRRYQLEYGYLYIVKLAKILPFGAQGIFIISSLIMTLFLFNLFKSFPRYLACGIFCFFLCGPYDFEINGVRQGIAILAFLNACYYLKEGIPVLKSILGYTIWIILGTLFHSSCILMLLLYPLKYINLNNRIIRFVLIVAPIFGYILNISGIAGSLFNMNGIEVMDSNYSSYLSDEKSDYLKMAADGLNLGQFMIFFFSMIPLYYIKKVFDKNNDLKVYIILYSIGLTISSMFIGNMMITRFSYYFTFSLLLLYPAYTRIIGIKRQAMEKNLVGTGLHLLFWTWFLVQFFYNLPRFFELQVWPDAALFGICIV